MVMIRLKKYHGLSNDYLVFDPNRNEAELDGEKVAQICDRHTGAGADGILYGPFIEEGKIKVVIFNSDGSQAENSGNGVRIFAKYLLEQEYVTGRKVIVTTASGDVEMECLDCDSEAKTKNIMRMNLGKPDYAGASLPMAGMQESEVVNVPLSFHDTFYNSTCLSVGNPNVVIMMEEISSRAAEDLGPYVENSQYFPKKTNMQLTKVLDRANIQIEIYERGSGYTLASGTGAAAAAAAARRMGLVEEKVTVHMPGGELVVEIDEDETIYMTGSVGYVGEFILSEQFFA